MIYLCAKCQPYLVRSFRLNFEQTYIFNAYWSEFCQKIQDCSQIGNVSGLYSNIRKALGPIPTKIAPLKESDGSVISDTKRQLDRWVEHYTGLYSNPVDISSSALRNIPKLPVMEDLDALPTIAEFNNALYKLKSGKSPGNDGVSTDLLKVPRVMPLCYNLLVKCWTEGQVPQDMRDANIVTLYKGKGDRGNCNSYRGISLLSIVGKLFARVILGKLQQIADRIYPEAQCGFRSKRSTTDMIFTLRQLQEKCREQRIPLYIAFVDLNKAFDTVSREGLYAALERVGCPSKLLSLIKSFHDDMNGTVAYNGHISPPFHMRRGVRQGCVLAPTLFGVFFSLLLKHAFGNSQQGIHIHTRKDGKLFNIALLRSRRFREDLFVDSLLFADDAAFVANTPHELQLILSKFADACAHFAMSINPKKTVVMTQGCIAKPVIQLGNTPLEIVDVFCYLGSTICNNLSLDAEINSRIGKASTMFGKLYARVWTNKHLTTKTKMSVYQTCILSILLYGSETWTSYSKQERRLNNYHMRCLRNILGLTWKDKVTNERVLSIAQIPSITALLRQRRLRWLGHVQRMDAYRLPRQVLLSEIANAKRPIGRPLLRFKDSVKRDMVSFNINFDKWEERAANRDEWRKSVVDGVKIHDKTWLEQLAHKRDIRHNKAVLPAPLSYAGTNYKCQNCGRECRARIGLISHQRRCTSNISGT